jgi:hypothetical protein
MDKLGKKESKQARGTHILKSTDRQVRTWKESKQVRGTHPLESTDRQVRT